MINYSKPIKCQPCSNWVIKKSGTEEEAFIEFNGLFMENIALLQDIVSYLRSLHLNRKTYALPFEYLLLALLPSLLLLSPTI